MLQPRQRALTGVRYRWNKERTHRATLLRSSVGEGGWRWVHQTVSIFYAPDTKAMCTSAIIHDGTDIIKNQKAYAQTGGGIVADSDAEAEWDETITKARALIAGITAVNGILK